MPARVVRARDLVRTPWKNGGGTTAEIAVHPLGAGFDRFDWRLSMADVATEGSFSTFPGIDRTLVLIEGAGLDLLVDGAVHRLDAANPMHSFPGEAATSARLPGGPIRDFNIMTRRGRTEHEAVVVPAGRYDAASAVLALTAATDLEWDGRAFVLDRFDCILDESPGNRIAIGRPALLVRLSQVLR